MKNVGLIVNRRKKGAEKLALKLKSWLRKRGKKVLSDSGGLGTILQKADLIVCFGGDGTILNVAGKLNKSTPVVGVNLGGLGFLTSVQDGEVFREMEAIFEKTCRVEERILMKVNLITQRGKKSFQALNDAVINREGLSRYVRIEVRARGEDLMKFSGDGVIVSTPTGSTAYSLSAGGPFVYPTLESFVVTPLSAHSLLTRPIVLPAAGQIEIRFRTQGDEGQASLVIDGQTRKVIRPSDVVKITLSPIKLRLVSSSEHSYLETLREKFGLVESKN